MRSKTSNNRTCNGNRPRQATNNKNKEMEKRKKDAERKRNTRQNMPPEKLKILRQKDAERKRNTRLKIPPEKLKILRQKDAERKRKTRVNMSEPQRTQVAKERREKENRGEVVELAAFSGDEGCRRFASMLAPANGRGRPCLFFNTPESVKQSLQEALDLADSLSVLDCQDGLERNVLSFVHGLPDAPCAAIWISPSACLAVCEGKRSAGSKLNKICQALQKSRSALEALRLSWTFELEGLSILIYLQEETLKTLAEPYDEVVVATSQTSLKQAWHLDAAFGEGGSTNFLWSTATSPWTEVCTFGERGSMRITSELKWRPPEKDLKVEEFKAYLESNKVSFDSPNSTAKGGDLGLSFPGQNWHRGVGHTGPRSTVFCSGIGPSLTLAKENTSKEEVLKFWSFDAAEFQPSVLTVEKALENARDQFGKNNCKEYKQKNCSMNK